MERKTAIRKEILEKRRMLSDVERQKASAEICRNIAAMDVYRKADWIYGYMPIQGEADVTPLLAQALEEGKRVALPRVAGSTMEFYQVASLEEVEEGAFHVLEPLKECPLVDAPGFVLVPGAAFDQKGGRIGYGKGYYDRYFSSHSQKLYKLGIGYTIQIIDTIPTTSLDVPLDGVLTEKGCILCT